MDTFTRLFEGLLAGDMTSIAVAAFAVIGTIALYYGATGIARGKAKQS